MKKKTITFTIDNDIHSLLKRECDKKMMLMSELMRELIIDFLKKREY